MEEGGGREVWMGGEGVVEGRRGGGREEGQRVGGWQAGGYVWGRWQSGHGDCQEARGPRFAACTCTGSAEGLKPPTTAPSPAVTHMHPSCLPACLCPRSSPDHFPGHEWAGGAWRPTTLAVSA